MAGPTIKTIAADLGISHMTVSRALSGGARVAQPTRDLVEKRARELGYIGSQAARTIRSGRSRVLGLSLPNLQNEFYAELANRVAELAMASDAQVMIGLTLDDPAREAVIIRQFLAQRVAMIAMVPAPDGGFPAQPGGMNVLELVRRRRGSTAGFLGIDDGPPIAEAVGLLAAAGHSRIGFIGSPLSLSTGHERRRAFETAAAECGLALDLARSVAPTEVGGAAAIRELMINVEPPTAVVLAGVELSKGALRFHIENRTDRPSKLTIVAYGDPPWVRWTGHGASAISLPEIALAEALVSRFVAALEDGGPPPSSVPDNRLPARLVRPELITGVH